VKRQLSKPSTAYHEAGHIVAAVSLGVDLSYASIFADDVSKGRVALTPEQVTTFLDAVAISQGDPWHPARLEAEKWVMVLQAGETAQRHYNSSSIRRYRFQTDQEMCFEILRRYAPDEGQRETEAHSRLLRTWTAHLILQNWESVEAVAKALLECGELSAAQIIDVAQGVLEEERRMKVEALVDAVKAIRERRDQGNA
jgi:hypothetical protein